MEETTQKIESNSIETQLPVDEPLYISIEGLFGCPSPPEVETPTETRRAKRARKQKGSYYDDPDWEFDFNSRSEDEFEPPVHTQSSAISGDASMEGDQFGGLSKKQLNRLAAMEIYPIPSGGLGTGNASLFNPVTVQWLLENYENKTGVSLPRSTVYNHYIRHCRLHDMEPVNAASFGKLIRSIFLGLQTRRLGTRGNSKYHYYGIQIKADSLLNNFKLGNCKLNMLSEAVRPYFEDASRSSSYSKMNEINISAALSMNINPNLNEEKYSYLIESYRQALSNITDLDGYSAWLESEVEKKFSPFREPGGDDAKFTEFVQVYLKDMSFILYVICSQMVLVDPESNTFFSLLQLFTNNYILYLLENNNQ